VWARRRAAGVLEKPLAYGWRLPYDPGDIHQGRFAINPPSGFSMLA
jgi:hypothetical protein